MKKTALFIAGLLMIAVLASCATYNYPITATGEPLGSKTGQATGTTYLWLFGDGSTANIVAAAQDGQITKISTVDYRLNNVLHIVQTYTCVVTGE